VLAGEEGGVCPAFGGATVSVFVCWVWGGDKPTAIFCVKFFGDSDVRRVEGTVAALTAAGQLVVLIGNEVVGKFESVESWWRESEDAPETQ
jgi:hypothetical protein